MSIVHGPIISQIKSGKYDAVLLFYRVGVHDSAYAQELRDAFKIEIPDRNFFIRSAQAPNFSIINICLGKKYVRLYVVYIKESNMLHYQLVRHTIQQIAEDLRHSHVALLNDDLEFGDWAELAPTIIHFAKLTLLSPAFGAPVILNAKPLTHSANETAEQ